MGEIAIRLGESVCMAAADARWIGSHLNCYRLDRMEDVGASLLLTCAGLLAAAILTCRRPRRRPALAARTSRPGAARRLDLLAGSNRRRESLGQRTPEPEPRDSRDRP
jgi:hypothetical protein